MEQSADHGDAFEQSYRRMEARRRGEERSFLHVQFLRGERVEKERILEERYACRAMERWTSRGCEFKVRNQPFQLPPSGVAATIMQARGLRSQAARFVA
ncbi:MAG: hypothetical protein NTW28_13255 [Candidatus Solibacter sp.]|nr:hypothetical protein [Candidatus Solibacter sp.]